MKPLIVALSLLMLGGCATYGSVGAGEFDQGDFGEANRQTYAAMIIDPDPQYEEPMATSADHAADAIERYRTDKVKHPDTIRATEGVASSGGRGGN